MCGVAGIFCYHYAALPVDRSELRAIRDSMAARGPDGEGEWFSPDGRVALGHRRLSIIDLSDKAAQPMASADGQHVISFNGEIYNFRELRAGLEATGVVFRTESDTEVLLHLYAAKGEAMLADLRGMFAFALWDKRRQALLLARDPYGIKPLYFSDDGWTLRVASQVKALLASAKVSRAPEPAGLAGFYLFGSVPEPYTLYQEVRSVPAGSYQWVDDTGPHPAVPYFSLARVWSATAGHDALAPAELQERVRSATLDSVRHHLVADVPVGAFLSAGIDSGTLVGLMKDAGQRDIQTVTLAFEEFRGTPQDEAPLAEEVARLYGARHTTRMVREQEFREDLPSILSAMDQPSIDGINTWFVSKAAHEAGMKVAISGVGGDELFGGYPSFRDIPMWVRTLWLPARIPGLGLLMEQVQSAFAPLFPALSPKAASMLRYGGTYPGAWLLRRGLFMPHELAALMGRDLAKAGLERLRPIEHITAVIEPVPARPYARVAALEGGLYLRNQLLRDTDWAGMAHSLEVRTPLVDAALVQVLAGPLSATESDKRKLLLAAVPYTPLPRAVSLRAKSGFTTPVSRWQQDGRRQWARRWSDSVAKSAGVDLIAVCNETAMQIEVQP